jgi:hypothetical protein
MGRGNSAVACGQQLCKIGFMERDHVIAALKAHEQELRSAGVLSVSLFGSVAGGEVSAQDVDVAVRLGETFSARAYPAFLDVRWTSLKSRCAGNVFKPRSTGTAPLPSDKPLRRLEDIIENAQAIQRYETGMDLTAFAKDQKTYDAVERCLERISEAAAKLVTLPRPSWRVSPGGK